MSSRSLTLAKSQLPPFVPILLNCNSSTLSPTLRKRRQKAIALNQSLLLSYPPNGAAGADEASDGEVAAAAEQEKTISIRKESSRTTTQQKPRGNSHISHGGRR